MTDGDEAADTAVSDPGQTHFATFEAATELPSIALVEAVAAVKDVDPAALDPLGRHVDMDALNAFLQSSLGEHGTSVTLEFQGVRATVEGDGQVRVRPSGSDVTGADP